MLLLSKMMTWLLSLTMFASCSYHMHTSAFSFMTLSAKKTLDRRSVLDNIVTSTGALLTVYTIDNQPAGLQRPLHPLIPYYLRLELRLHWIMLFILHQS